jgi:glycosyltransferase involved in cell wall biosynthesis
MSRSILHLIRTLDPEQGGPITFLKQLSAVHAAMGVRVAVLTLDRNEPSWVAALPVSPLECAPSRSRYGYNPGLESKLTELAGTFDTMVVHGLWQFHGFSAMRVSARIDVPYFVFPHGMLDPWFRRSYPIKHLKKQLYWMLAERRVLQGAKAVLFTSESESRLARVTFLPEARYRGRILPLGVEKNSAASDQLRELFFKEFPYLRGRRFLLFLGRLHPKKGCDLLVRAMARIRPRIDLVFAGPISNEEYVCKLKRSAEGLPIVFTGMLHGDLKSGALAAAEALILPSHQENFGLVVAEALSFGTPVLLSDRVGVAEDVVSSGAGFMEPDTLVGTERLIERWLQEGTLAMRTSALNCFQNRFDIKHSARELMRILFSDG